MARNIQVNLTFSADTNAAKAQLQQLQQSLSNLTSSVNLGGKITAEMQQSITKVNELKVALNNATNVDTGKLNFSKFSQELKANKIQLQDYAKHLSALGPQGVQAFTELTRAVQMADTSLFSIQGQIRKLGTTMANTIRWQITSSLTTGLISAFTSVIDYAEELNESLNKIRIVTGKSQEEMGRFAKEAAKAAKELSITTTEYTDAALIYYQQGLSTKDVKARTDITTKLAKVVGEEAETVSEWMTAIWNNFAEGSDNLEHYADVLTALGAATASSADEIAGGLEKFAAISDTVGLSYEYAAAALATITAETRQSEDVVGTALKTIFSRIENLKLGETLEDGTDLGQYSEALYKIGVNIKDSNGELKDMDDILDQIGSQWGRLSRDEQVALAQSVAGIRQYNQFIALMDNYDVMERNLEIARDSTGELAKQHAIYEEGILGAQARVQLQLDNIKNSLLGEDDLAPILDTAASFLEIINHILDSIGGLKGLLLIVSNILLKTFSSQMVGIVNSLAASFTQMKNGLMGISATDSQTAEAKKMTDSAKNIALQTQGVSEGTATSHILQQNADITERRAAAEQKISAFAKESLNLAEQQIAKAQEEYLILSRKTDELQEQYELSRSALSISGIKENDINSLERAAGQQNRLEEEMNYSMGENKQIGAYGGNGKYASQFGVSKSDSGALQKDYDTMAKARENYNKALKSGQKDLTKERNAVVSSRKAYAQHAAQLSKSGKAIDKIKSKYKGSEKAIDKFTDAAKASNKTHKKTAESLNNLNGAVDNYNKNIDDALVQGKTFSETFVSSLDNIASAAMGFSMITSSIEAMVTSFYEGNTSISSLITNVAGLAVGFRFLYNAISQTNVAQGLSNILLGQANIIREKGLALILSEYAIKLKDFILEKGMNAIRAIGNTLKAIANAESLKSIAIKAKEAVQNIVLYTTEAAGRILAGDYGSAFLALALLGTAVAAGASSASSKNQEEEEEEKVNEAKEKNVEISDNLNETNSLANDFRQLYSEYQETGQGSDELIEKAKELNATLKDQRIELALLSGDFKALSVAIDEAMVAEAKAALDSINKNAGAITADVQNKMWEGEGHSTGLFGGTNQHDYQADIHSGGWGMNIKDDEKEIQAAIAKNQNHPGAKYIDTKYFDINLPGPNIEEQLVDAYEFVQTIVDEAEKNGATDDSETFKAYKNWLADERENYEAMKTLRGQQNSAKAKIIVGNTKSNAGNTLSGIKSQEEFENYKQTALASAENDEQRELIKTELLNSGNKFAINSNKIDTMEAAGLSRELAMEVYQNHGEEVQNAMAMIDAETLKKIGDNEKLLWDEINKNLEKTTKQQAENAFKVYEYDDKDAKLYINMLKSQNPLLEKNAIAANKAATAHIHLAEGFKDFTKVWDENKDAISEGGTAAAIAINNVSDSLKAMYNITDDISLAPVVAEHQNLINSMMNGSEEAYYKLTSIIAAEMAEAEGASLELITLIEQFNGKNYELGENISNDALIQSFNDSIAKGMELATVLSIIKQMGADATVENGKITNLTFIRNTNSILDQLKKRAKAAQKELKKLNEELERYYEINEEIDDINNNLDKLANAKERAFGKSKIQLIQQEKKELDKLADAEERLLQETRDYLALDLKELNKWGFSTNEEGRITNYDEVMAKQVAAYNAAQKAGGERAEKAKERWTEFENALSQYTETLNKLEEEEINHIETLAERRSKDLEEITVDTEQYFELVENELKVIEFQLSHLEDDAYDAAEAITLIGNKMELASQQYQKSKQDIYKILGDDAEAFLSGDYSNLDLNDFTKEEIDAVNTAVDEMMDAASTIEEGKNEIYDRATEGYINLTDEAAKFGEELEHNRSIVQNFQNIVDLVGKDRLGVDDAFMDQMAEMNKSIARDGVAAAKNAWEIADRTYKKALEENILPPEKIEELKQRAQEAQGEFMSSWQNSLEIAAEEFDNKVQRIMETYDKALGGLKDKIDQFATLKEMDDFFLKDYEKTYEISKLSRQITESMNKTINSKGKQDLANLNAEILEYQKQGKEMSDYDLQYLQKKYELTQAQIALEEAQNAKSQVRLTRDSEGNFGYTYTADQGAIDKAQQTYEDKIYGMEKFLDESSTQMGEKILQLQNQMSEELAALDKNAEDYEERAQEIVDKYTTQIDRLVTESSEMCQRGMEINEQYGTHAAETFKETLLGQIYGDYRTFESYFNGVKNGINLALGDLIKAHQDYEVDLEKTMGEAGTSIDTFKTDATEDLGEVQGAVTAINEEVDKMPGKFESAFQGITNALNTELKDYQDKMAAYKTEVTNLAIAVNNLWKEYAKLEDVELPDPPEDKSSTGGDGGLVDGGGGNENEIIVPETIGSGNWKITGSSKPRGSSERLYTLINDNGDTVERFESDLINSNGSNSFKTNDIVTLKDGSTPVAEGLAELTKILTGNNLTFNLYDKINAIPKTWDGIGRTSIKWKLPQALYSFKDGSPVKPGHGRLTNREGQTLYDSGAEWFAKNLTLIPDNIKEYNSDLYVAVKDLFDGGNLNHPLYIKAIDLMTWLGKPTSGISYRNYTTHLKTLGFDTGGYTGIWGPEGRLAMLHQKEIVLNAHDTENLLTAVEVVRSMADKLAFNAAMASQGLGNLVSSTGFIPHGENFEQNITIYADFPNATDRDSILEAFEHLSTSAMQYANSVDSLRAISRI